MYFLWLGMQGRLVHAGDSTRRGDSNLTSSICLRLLHCKLLWSAVQRVSPSLAAVDRAACRGVSSFAFTFGTSCSATNEQSRLLAICLLITGMQVEALSQSDRSHSAVSINPLDASQYYPHYTILLASTVISVASSQATTMYCICKATYVPTEGPLLLLVGTSQHIHNRQQGNDVTSLCGPCTRAHNPCMRAQGRLLCAGASQTRP